MNKYQEALNNFKNMGDKDLYNERHLEWIETLQELVDKETPNVFVNQFGVVKCGNCKEPITYPKYGSAKYCLHCGQALDWSDK